MNDATRRLPLGRPIAVSLLSERNCARDFALVSSWLPRLTPTFGSPFSEFARVGRTGGSTNLIGAAASYWPQLTSSCPESAAVGTIAAMKAGGAAGRDRRALRAPRRAARGVQPSTDP